MHDRQAYEDNVITEFANMFRQRRPGISDADVGNEFEAARIFFTALERFRADLTKAIPLTTLRKDALIDLAAAIDDTAPGMTSWEEELNNARRGYV